MLWTANIQDRVALRGPAARARARGGALNDLMLPLVKGYGSEKVVGAARDRVAAVLRWVGLLPGLSDRAIHPRRQDRLALRGHDAIQGQICSSARSSRTRAARLPIFPLRSLSGSSAEGGNGQLKEERALLQQGLDDVGASWQP